MKNDQYFNLEANIMDNDNVCLLIEKHGMEGFGIYIALLLELRRRDDYYSSMQTLPRMARNMCVDTGKIKKIITESNLFCLHGDTGAEVFTAPYLDRVMKSLDAVRRNRKITGKKKSLTVKRAPNGRFAASEPTEEKSKEKKSKEEKSTSSSTPIQSWEAYVNEAVSSQAWLDVVGMKSGLRMDFINHLPFIIRTFKEHVLAQGSEGSILSLRDAKSYFANFIRQGTKTNKRVAELLEEEKTHRLQHDPYRYEDVNPETGARYYCGIPIPKDAPPRPNPDALWNTTDKRWET